MPPTSLAHRRSRRFAIDPCYSATQLRPSPDGLARFLPTPVAGGWMYGPGDLDAYRLARLRTEAFRDCLNVFHPGLVARHHHQVTFRAQLPRVRSARVAVTLAHSGDLHLTLGGALVSHRDGATGQRRLRLDLGRHLRARGAELKAILNRVDEPPALLLDAMDVAWEVSFDGQHWTAPERYADVGGTTFPHQEECPAERLRPVATSGGEHDFGRIVLARPMVVGKAAPRFAAGESLDELRDRDPTHAEQAIVPVRDGARWTTRGPLAFRWLRAEAKPAAVSCAATFRPVRYAGAFACSDDALTRIWMHAAYTVRLCLQDFLLDGVKRDRLPWVGDLYLSLQAASYAFGEHDAAGRTLAVLAADRPAECEHNGIIDYTCAWIVASAEHVRHSGDLAFARHWLPRVRELLAIDDARASRDGFLHHDPATWLFIDWAPMDKRAPVAALQLLRVMAREAAAELATAAGDRPSALAWTRSAAALRRRCVAAFWDRRRGGFVEHRARGPRPALSRHASLLAVLAGAAVGPRRLAVARLLRGAEATPVGTPYMAFLEGLALHRCGDARAAVDGIRRYWGGMIAAGATTFWEAFDPAQSGPDHLAFYGRPFGRSLCHAWAAGPAAALPRLLLGIRPLAPGWSRVACDPTPCGLSAVHVSVPTPHGDIVADLEHGRLRVRVPRGMTLVLRGRERAGPAEVAVPLR